MVAVIICPPFPARSPPKVVEPVPPLATMSVPPKVKVPEVVNGPPVRVSPVVPPEPSTEVTEPAPVPAQVPRIEKQPASKSIPFA